MNIETEKSDLNHGTTQYSQKAVYCSPCCRAASVAGSVAVIAFGVGFVYGGIANSSAPYQILKIGASVLFGGSASLLGVSFLSMAIFECKKPQEDLIINEV